LSASLPIRIGQWLARARVAGAARLDAQQLLAHHLGRPRAWLLAHDDEPIPAAAAAAADADLARRLAGVPLAYLTGEREFFGLMLEVGPDVLVPRPETEELVEWALELAPSAPQPTLIDLGTGSGAIALAFKQRAPQFEVTATDASAAALAIAQRNAARLKLELRWLLGDWWQALERTQPERFGLVVSNPPYIAEGDPHLPALRHEPAAALVAGGDGLAAIRVIVDGAVAHLAAGGWLLLEHGFSQGEAVRALLGGAGFVDVQTRADLAGLPRCTGGRRPNR
jgi:release factor glutamine methyltransferase